MIDIEKFICDINKIASVRANHELCHALDYAFNQQGLECKDGNIVPIGNKPKFKVGDWVVWDNKVSCHVDNIYQGKESLMYTITDVNNMTRSYSVKGFDNNAHLWTIQDAKAGDVLCSGQMILLFKKWEDSDWNFVIAYVGIDISGKLQITNGHWLISNYTHPATKEQRDTLFAKMKEAGYEWDAEKKELKKIEPKEELSEFENIVEEIADTSILNAYGVKELAKRLLSNAKKQLQQEFDKQLEQAYKNADKVQYERGYRKAVEDARKWVAYVVDNDEEFQQSNGTNVKEIWK